MITAIYRDRPPDFVGSIVAVLGISIPSFLLGILLILFLSVEWRVFPSSGYGGSLTSAIWSLVSSGTAKAAIAVDTESPMSAKNPRSLKVAITDAGSSRVAIVNHGFYGIGINKGESYTLSLHARAAADFL